MIESCLLRHLIAASLAMISVDAASVANAARAQGDWPCVQREVPEISTGMVWTGSPIDMTDKSWSSDAEVAVKVAEITSRRHTVEDAIAIIDGFAAVLTQDRAGRLTALFKGVLQRVNAERAQIMAGIKRYARKQAALADTIKAHAAEQTAIQVKAPVSEEDKRRLADLDEQLAWDIRIYEEREQSLRYVCEMPVLLEQRIFQIGRHVSQLVAQN